VRDEDWGVRKEGRVKKVHSYQDLAVWQKGMQLVTSVYSVTRTFPREEMYGLTSQIRRAVVSVPANIAEGWGRRSTKEYIQFLRIARGSLLELGTLLLIAVNLGYLTTEKAETMLDQVQEISRMLSGLMSSLNRRK
jgi:four helix bundle protein